MMDSIVLGDGFEDADADWDQVDPRFDAPHTPSSTSDDAPLPQYDNDTSDADTDEETAARGRGELVPRRKPGGYDSRIEQILYENPELPILITDAGKSMESGGRYIVYTIRTGVRDFYNL
jgi:sorting nexin-41/42